MRFHVNIGDLRVIPSGVSSLRAISALRILFTNIDPCLFLDNNISKWSLIDLYIHLNPLKYAWKH